MDSPEVETGGRLWVIETWSCEKSQRRGPWSCGWRGGDETHAFKGRDTLSPTPR